MKNLLVLGLIVVAMIGLLLAVLSGHKGEIKHYAKQFGLKAVGHPDLKAFDVGPFWFRSKSDFIYSMPVMRGEENCMPVMRGEENCMLWVRLGLLDSVILVDSRGREETLK